MKLNFNHEYLVQECKRTEEDYDSIIVLYKNNFENKKYKLHKKRVHGQLIVSLSMLTQLFALSNVVGSTYELPVSIMGLSMILAGYYSAKNFKYFSYMKNNAHMPNEIIEYTNELIFKLKTDLQKTNQENILTKELKFLITQFSIYLQINKLIDYYETATDEVLDPDHFPNFIKEKIKKKK